MSPKTYAEALIDAMTNPSPVKAATINSFLDLFEVKNNVVIGAYGNRYVQLRADQTPQ